jgi:hypothetical protein
MGVEQSIVMKPVNLIAIIAILAVAIIFLLIQSGAINKLISYSLGIIGYYP